MNGSNVRHGTRAWVLAACVPVFLGLAMSSGAATSERPAVAQTPTPVQSPVCRNDPPDPASPPPTNPPLTLTVRTDRPIYAPGEAVRLTLTVENSTYDPVTVHTNLIADFRITSWDSGTEVWRLSNSPIPIPPPRYCTFLSGTAITNTGVRPWDHRDNHGQLVAPGQYAVTGRLFGMSEFSSAITLFSITASASGPIAVYYPGQADLPPLGTLNFSYPQPPLGTPRIPGGGRWLNVVNQSSQPAVVSYDGEVLSVRVSPPDHRVRFLSGCVGAQTNHSSCLRFPCGVECPPPNRMTQEDTVAFTSVPVVVTGEAALDLSDPRPCIANPNSRALARIPEGIFQRICTTEDFRIWEGSVIAWSQHGVTDRDAVFNETVAYRVRLGDPAATSNLARALGWPYVQITRVRFAGNEFIELTNLGGAAQDLKDWTLNGPAPPRPEGARSSPVTLSVRWTGTAVLQPGQRCRVHLRAGTSTCGFVDRIGGLPSDYLPESGGPIVLMATPIGLEAARTYYSGDPANQPSPPNLQLAPPDSSMSR
jgi:hypothetical protein